MAEIASHHFEPKTADYYGTQSRDEKTNVTSASTVAERNSESRSVALAGADIEIKLQAQEFMYRTTLVRERHKVSAHALEEVGRSLTAISQRRRQYFLDYKNCSSIRQVRQWFVWETKRNLDTNHAELKTENAATRGLKVFLNKIEFYGTLLARFGEYVMGPLQQHYSVLHDVNFEVGQIRERMLSFQDESETLLSDNNEVVISSPNHSEVEVKYPVISMLPRVHDILVRLVDLATQWRIHARYGQMFERILYRRGKMESISQLDEKKHTLREIEHHLRAMRYEIKELENELQQRLSAIASRDFSDIYTEYSLRLEELEDIVEKKKKEIKSIETTIKYLHEKTETYKKIVQHKRKEKIEANIKKKKEKMTELGALMEEIERIEAHKKKMDETEEQWLRGGYERELGVTQDIRTKMTKMKKNMTELEAERDKLRKSYHETREKVMTLDGEHESLTHEYEYVKRLSSTVINSLWNVNVFSQLKVSAVQPNKINLSLLDADSAYVMNQPKGVAMVVSNDEPRANVLRGALPFSQSEASTFTKKRRSSTEVTSTKPTATVSAFSAAFAQIGYYVINRHQLTTDSLRKNLSGMSDQYHSFACSLNSLMLLVIAQSNEQGRIIGGGGMGGVTPVSGFLEHFTSARCPSLIGKPKVFIFLLRVTDHEPRIPVINKKPQVKKSERKKIPKIKEEDNDDVFLKSSTASTPTETTHFHPDPIDVSEFGKDILVVRVMYQDDKGADETPTFGGTSHVSVDKLPWHVQILLSTLMQLGGTKDIINILVHVKEEVQMASKNNESSSGPSSREIVEFFVDHSLSKKLYLIPGI